MSQNERIFYIIDKLARDNGSVSLREISETYSVCRRQAARDIQYVRDRILDGRADAIVYDPHSRAYRLSGDSGLFNNWRSKILIAQAIAEAASSDVFYSPSAELPDLMRKTLSHIEYRAQASELSDYNVFSSIVSAFESGRAVRIRYSRYGKNTERVAEPLKLINYDQNWYLAAWDRSHCDIRVFLLSRIKEAIVLDDPVAFSDWKKLDAFLSSGYGIFMRAEKPSIYRMRFYGNAAYIVSTQVWHKEQKGRWAIPDECYELEVPANSTVELMNKLFSFRGDAVPVAPESFVEEYKSELDRIRQNALMNLGRNS
ncbi:MAG: WYL domain-containing protein [Candidatus Ornithospirochaeta sp.]|nr:WYL domain-containing protein [Candidatus Ornithospirochaeta sp.]